MGLDFYLSVVQVCAVASTDCCLTVSVKSAKEMHLSVIRKKTWTQKTPEAKVVT